MPEPLKRGDTVAVTAASGPIARRLVQKGIRFLETLGFRVVLGRHVYERSGYLAGSDEQRCLDLNTLLRNPEVRGIFFARGGYGVMRLLEAVDLPAIEADPKVLVGMSDLTALQLSLYARCGLVTLSGPMPGTHPPGGLDAITADSFEIAVTGPVEHCSLLGSWNRTLRVVRHGKASGPLLGGCLSLVAALVGTKHMPDLSAAILFLEDVGEAAYRIDRMLMQLKLAGILDGVGGIVLGHFLGPDGKNISRSVERIVAELTPDKGFPIVSGFPHGHKLPNLTIPHGMPVVVDTVCGRIEVAGTTDSSEIPFI